MLLILIINVGQTLLVKLLLVRLMNMILKWDYICANPWNEFKLHLNGLRNRVRDFLIKTIDPGFVWKAQMKKKQSKRREIESNFKDLNSLISCLSLYKASFNVRNFNHFNLISFKFNHWFKFSSSSLYAYENYCKF